MDVRVLDPATAADPAARVLAEAWPPPCLAYPPDSLRWELAAPGPAPVAVLAEDGGEPAGFAAAVPRRVRFRGADRDVYLVSFVAVRPGWQGRGVSGRLYGELLAALRPAGLPVVTFAHAGTAGQAALDRAYPRAGWSIRKIDEFRVHATLVPAGPSPEPADPAAFDALPARQSGPDALHDLPAWDHLAADPRPRAVVVARSPDGGGGATARVLRQPVVNPDGPGVVAVVEGIRLAAGAGPGALKDVVQAAGRAWPNPAGKQVVTVPNVTGIDPAHLRTAGLRQTPTVFYGYVAAADPNEPMIDATAADLPVV